MSDDQLNLDLSIPASNNLYICYSATHTESKRRYIGITKRSLQDRQAEHENHAKIGTDNNFFHQQLRRLGLQNFKWEILAYGNEKIIRILEKTLINRFGTLSNDIGGGGFNSNNEADDLYITPNELNSFEYQHRSSVKKLEKIYELQDILSEFSGSSEFAQESKKKFEELLNYLKERGNNL